MYCDFLVPNQSYFSVQQENGKTEIWFIFQKTKYVWDDGEKKQFCPLVFPVDHTIGFYLDNKGLLEEEDLKHAHNLFGNNTYAQINIYMILFVTLMFVFRSIWSIFRSIWSLFRSIWVYFFRSKWSIFRSIWSILRPIWSFFRSTLTPTPNATRL